MLVVHSNAHEMLTLLLHIIKLLWQYRVPVEHLFISLTSQVN